MKTKFIKDHEKYENDTEVRVGQENTLCDENKVVFNGNMPHSPVNGSNSLILERQNPPNPLFFTMSNRMYCGPKGRAGNKKTHTKCAY